LPASKKSVLSNRVRPAHRIEFQLSSNGLPPYPTSNLISAATGKSAEKSNASRKMLWQCHYLPIACNPHSQ